MKKAYEITGKAKMNGIINVQGSKNSALAIIIASLLTKDIVIIDNVPRIKDVFELLTILKKINVNISFIGNSLLIDSSKIKYSSLLLKEIKEFRASYYFVGLFLTLFNEVEIYLPGGCNIGKRPIDQHIKGLTALNVNLCITSDVLKANSLQIIGNEISLDIASVGATINIILTAIFANKQTIIKNAAKEPEIIDMIAFLNKMGAKISGQGSSVIIIEPVNKLTKTNYTIMPDRIVAGTYLIYGALLAEKLTLNNIKTKHLTALINELILLGAEMDIKKDSITIYQLKNFDSKNIKTGVYPYFPSDLQQVMTTFLFNANNASLVEETLFENRFKFLNEIAKMSGKFLIISNKVLVVPSILNPEIISCNDLRGGAALLLACLMTNGVSILKDVEYIERGYEDIVNVLKNVNVNIKEIDIDEA